MALPPLRATISMTTWSSLTCRTSGNRFSRALLMLTAVISASLRLVQESCTSVRHRGRGRQGGRPSTSYSAEMPEPLCRSRCAAAVVRCARAGTIGRAQLAGSLHGGRAARLVVAGARRPALRRPVAGVQPPRQPYRPVLRLVAPPACRFAGPVRRPALRPPHRPGPDHPLLLGRAPRDPPSGDRCPRLAVHQRTTPPPGTFAPCPRTPLRLP